MNTVIDKEQSKIRLDIIGKFRKKYCNQLDTLIATSTRTLKQKHSRQQCIGKKRGRTSKHQL